MEKEYFDAFRMLCKEHGFTVRGMACFRVHGDGVLQTIKCSKVRNFSAYRIDFGLFSMYGDLKKSWFTASGCINRYSVVSYLGEQNAIFLSEIGHNVYTLGVVSLKEQIQLLKERLLPLLDGITTQCLLIDAIFELAPYWNDDIKFEPYLKIGEFNLAAKVVQAILDQHHDAMARKSTYMDPLEFNAYVKQREAEDAYLVQKLEMALGEDIPQIEQYLAQNYERNYKWAKAYRLVQ